MSVDQNVIPANKVIKVSRNPSELPTLPRDSFSNPRVPARAYELLSKAKIYFAERLRCGKKFLFKQMTCYID